VARIAVVGAGISGLSAADLLSVGHDVVLFEREPRPGGHSRTLTVPRPDGPLPVDTGFIVYNEVNYPLLTKLFAALSVPTKPSDMSFGLRYGDGELEFSASSLEGLFAQRKNLASPRYLRMLADILRFFRSAKLVLEEPGDPTLGEFIERLAPGDWFEDRFLVPMGAAIWSTPPREMLAFPAKTFVRFFDNHGLLSINGHHRWRTVEGGSQEYVRRIVERLGARVRGGSPVAEVRAENGGFEVVTAAGDRDRFDEVVLAAHADASLAMIAEPTAEERRILGAFRFRDNEAVLHTDVRLMPQAKAAWASWVYAAGGQNQDTDVSVTYWMNKLQSLPGEDVFVSLNPDREIAPGAVIDRHVFRHPMFDRAAVAAQDDLASIQGTRGLWFCGAWQRYGFHEDGLWSAVRVAKAKGVSIPWL
jgi:predicted NAD/FAD-binding protein